MCLKCWCTLYCQRGRLHEKKEELHEAKMCYENAVAINPTHVRSLQHLVSYTLLRVFSLKNEKKNLRRGLTPWLLQINTALCIYF